MSAELFPDLLGKLTGLPKLPSWIWGGESRDKKWIQKGRETIREGQGKEGKKGREKEQRAIPALLFSDFQPCQNVKTKPRSTSQRQH